MTQEEKEQECKKCGRVFGSVWCFDVDCPNNTPKITMTQEEQNKILDLYERISPTFSCNLCKERLNISTCKGCPIYCQTFNND